VVLWDSDTTLSSPIDGGGSATLEKCSCPTACSEVLSAQEERSPQKGLKLQCRWEFCTFQVAVHRYPNYRTPEGEHLEGSRLKGGRPEFVGTRHFERGEPSAQVVPRASYIASLRLPRGILQSKPRQKPWSSHLFPTPYRQV